ncbi:MAG TPA: hypothetical protein DEV87_04410 [Clostridiales bacterium]|nr:hypothetical protein [Clostridiales bacterium]
MAFNTAPERFTRIRTAVRLIDRKMRIAYVRELKRRRLFLARKITVSVAATTVSVNAKNFLLFIKPPKRNFSYYNTKKKYRQ